MPERRAGRTADGAPARPVPVGPIRLAASVIALGLAGLPGLAGDAAAGEFVGLQAAAGSAPFGDLVVAPDDDPGADPDFAAFLDRWCVSCHSGLEPAMDLDLEAFRFGGANEAEAALAGPRREARALAAVVERLVRRDMPPEDDRPDEAAYEAAIAQARALLEHVRARVADAPVDPGRTTARRLTRVEYRHHVRDLFGVAVDVTERLPRDEVGGAFDNDGDVLSIPPLLLEKYFDVAELVAQQAVHDAPGAEPPRTRLAPRDLRNTGGGNRANGGWSLFSSGAVVGPFDAGEGGRFRLRAQVAGQQAGPEPVRFALVVDGRPVRGAEVAVREDRTPVEIDFELELGPGGHDLGVAFTNDYYRPEAEDPRDRDRNAWVGWIELEGPEEREPTALQRRLAALSAGAPASARLRIEVGHLAERAWRRPPDAEDLGRLLAVARDAAGRGASHEERLRIAITALLVHPRFLLRIERSPAPGDPPIDLDDWEIAARLASFLWTSAPDDALRADAAAGRLATPRGRRAAVERMLADPRASALAGQFGTQWLRIRALEDHEPDPERFPEVDRDLRRAMTQETLRFLDAMLRERRPIRELLTADWTFLDARLAEHYGLDADLLLGPAPAPGLQRVSLAAAAGGGGGTPTALGVLRHGSVLLATSNPTRTSPVKRGKWILEAMLDDPLPPPPPDAGVLAEEAGVGAARSIRERLERHRRDPSCAACHRRLDPLGFALESFDAVGRWRTEDEGRPVDARGELPGGVVLDGPLDLRGVLEDDPRFARSLAAHLATWAIGRGLRPEDDGAIAAIVERASAGRVHPNDLTLADLVLAVVESPIFRQRAAWTPPASDDDRIARVHDGFIDGSVRPAPPAVTGSTPSEGTSP